jgi:hypothetical protein
MNKMVTLDTEAKEGLEKLQEWADKILKEAERFDEALKSARLNIESELAKLGERHYDLIAHRIEQRIAENK